MGNYQEKRAKDLINTFIWHKNFPFKMSFYIWRALRGKLPTNEKLISLGIEPANCYCSHRPRKDEIDHILVSGNFSNHIWKFHVALMGIKHSSTTLRSLLVTWRSIQHSNETHKHLNQALPIFTCWNLWKNRCLVKYEGKQSSIGRVKYLIFKDMMQLFINVFPYLQWLGNWKEVISMLENCRHELKVISVWWDKPTRGVYKLNTYGSALNNLGKIRGGGILRDDQGNMIYAYAIPLGFGTNNKAEIQAATHGANWCLQHGYKKIILEVDSKLLSKWINHNSSPPWQIQQYTQELKNISRQFEYFQCKHTYKEANCTADHLSKWSHRQDIIQHFYTHHQLPGAAKGSYILEKMDSSTFPPISWRFEHWVYSPGEEVHLTAISSIMVRPISGDKNSGEQTSEKLQGEGGATRGAYSMDEEVHHTNIPINIAQEHNQEEIQASPNGQKQDQHSMEQQKIKMKSTHGDTRISQDLTDQQGNTKPTSLEVIEVESSSHFSFGVKPMDTRTSIGGKQIVGKANNYTNKVDNDYMQEQQAINNNSQRRNPSGDGTQAGKSSHSNACRDVVSLSSSDDYVNVNAKGQKNVVLNDQEHGRGDIEPHQQTDRNHGSVKNNSQTQLPDLVGNSESNNYHKEFPKISSNFDRHTIANQKGQQTNHPNQLNGPRNLNENQKIKQDQSTEPTPYTVEKLHLTDLVGWGVNVAHYNAKHVFIDLENELDYNTVWTQQRMTIEGKLMRIQAWNPNFRPEQETPIVPIWVLLPGLPWHCFKKKFITPLLESVGKVLYLDTTSIKKTRASMAKVKVQVDLTKARPRHSWIGLDDEDLSIGRWQSIEYENIPPYCVYCTHQGHMIGDCNFKIRDEDFKRKKELREEMKNMNKGEQGQQRSDHKQTRIKEQEEQQHQNTKEGSNQQQAEQLKEEEWQVSRKNNKLQEEKLQKTVWRPTLPQNKMSKEQSQITAQQIGTLNTSNHNSFTKLNMQEKQPEDIQEHNSNEGTVQQGAQSRSKAVHNQKGQVKQIVNKVNNKSIGIDTMLPIPTNPNSSYFYGVVEVEGGMDGGC
ncbi:hypothetical protein MTR67_023560 [Solanum verrucosum]|uniref:RNase H type-1 domain-containing protein n=1 Tax=Solanum verrucosum TaxID=315347 RepID=A0AAF0TXR4_SOLVR|nr:hypothetical protein MTR67_023560 [Solanum verrucosum]